MVGGDVHNISVDSDVAMKHELTCSCAGGSDAKAINHVVQTAFEKLEQDFTGDTFGARSLVEEVAELAFEYAVCVFGLLFLAKLNAVFRCFAATVLAVLTRRKFLLSSTLSGPKMGSPNLRAILVLGPVYLAMRVESFLC